MQNMALSLSATSVNSRLSFPLKNGRLLAIIVTLLCSSICQSIFFFLFYRGSVMRFSFYSPQVVISLDSQMNCC